jgi:small subunit ribosomal protein S1
MSSNRRTVRRNRGDEPENPDPTPDFVPAAPIPDLRGAKGPQRSRGPTPEQLASERGPRLDLSDLEDLMRMDPNEIADLLGKAGKRAIPKIGQRVKGVITRIGSDRALVDIGGKSDATLPRVELGDRGVGDAIEAYVVDDEDGEMRLSMAPSGAAADTILSEAKANKTPMPGVVSGRNPGGFDVRLGATRAFCPTSQIDKFPASDLDSYVGQTFEFLVTQTGGGDTIVSRRALQEERAKAGWDGFWEKVEVGATFDGRITNVQPFGVFVDVGGVEGLVHRSELGWEEKDPSSFKRGDKLVVRVTEIRRTEGKLGLSAKDPENSPWKRAIGGALREGAVVEGPVARVEAYGAFVELLPGVTGLLHNSRHVGPMPKAGDVVKVRIGKIDAENRRIELSDADAPEPKAKKADVEVTGVVEDVLNNGVVVALDDGRTGWLPTREIELPAGTLLAQKYRRGKPVTARVTEEAPDGRRVTLSQKAVVDDSWRSNKGSTGNFGTLGDLLKGLKR